MRLPSNVELGAGVLRVHDAVALLHLHRHGLPSLAAESGGADSRQGDSPPQARGVNSTAHDPSGAEGEWMCRRGAGGATRASGRRTLAFQPSPTATTLPAVGFPTEVLQHATGKQVQ